MMRALLVVELLVSIFCGYMYNEGYKNGKPQIIFFGEKNRG